MDIWWILKDKSQRDPSFLDRSSSFVYHICYISPKACLFGHSNTYLTSCIFCFSNFLDRAIGHHGLLGIPQYTAYSKECYIRHIPYYRRLGLSSMHNWSQNPHNLLRLPIEPLWKYCGIQYPWSWRNQPISSDTSQIKCPFVKIFLVKILLFKLILIEILIHLLKNSKCIFKIHINYHNKILMALIKCNVF